MNETTSSRKRSGTWWTQAFALSGCLVIGFLTQTAAQTEQRVDVRIRDFTFIATQAPLMLNVPAVITIAMKIASGITSNRRSFKAFRRK